MAAGGHSRDDAGHSGHLQYAVCQRGGRHATPYLLINNSIALLPIKIVDMFVGDTRQRPELGSALSLVLLGIVVLEICLSNLVKRHFEKGNR